jgi:hypothetical protein
MVDRLLSEAFDRVVEIRKSRLTLGIALATQLLDGAEPTQALLCQADAEATDPTEDGRTLIRSHRDPALRAGDVVRWRRSRDHRPRRGGACPPRRRTTAWPPAGGTASPRAGTAPRRRPRPQSRRPRGYTSPHCSTR